MSNAMPDTLAAALSLSDGDRAVLAYELLGSLPAPSALNEDDESLSLQLQQRLDSWNQDPTRKVDVGRRRSTPSSGDP
jgi:hypothetical protein